jgi:hypothetical protein
MVFSLKLNKNLKNIQAPKIIFQKNIIFFLPQKLEEKKYNHNMGGRPSPKILRIYIYNVWIGKKKKLYCVILKIIE